MTTDDEDEWMDALLPAPPKGAPLSAQELLLKACRGDELEAARLRKRGPLSNSEILKRAGVR